MKKRNLFKRTVAFGSALTMAATLSGCSSNQETPVTSPDSPLSTGNITGENGEKPNVVYIVLDDVGFGDLGCYGSSINTPNMDKLAKNGIQYTNYITSPMSSPSRASLLTGSESNFIGMGSVSDVTAGSLVPNIQGNVDPEHGFITHTLTEAGYNNMAVGKWHLSSYDNFTPDGNKQQWPSGRGFDMNYNFVGSQTNQFEPGGIFEGDKFIVPDTSDPNYHMTTDIFNKTLEYIDSTNDDEAFFSYVALGAMHGPFNVTKDYIEKYKGKFDEGWDVEREKIFKRQKELGLFPEDAEMPEQTFKAERWGTLNEKQKEVAARHMEVYAGFLEHTDAQLGKFLDELKKRDEYDNTLFVIVSDNGANSNAGPDGTLIAHDNENLYKRDFDDMYAHLDEFGSKAYGTQYNSAWAMVSDTPFRHYKGTAHYGGIRTLCIASWKEGIKEPGRLCKELVAVSDVPATILDVVGVEKLKEVNDVKQEPMQGISFKESFESSNPMTNSRESVAMMMMMDRTYINKDYTIVTNPKTREWELYDAINDPTQKYNLAEKMPEKLAEMLKEFETVEVEVLDSQNLVMDFVHGVKPEVLIERYGETAKEVLNIIQNGGKPSSAERAEYLKIIQAMTHKVEGSGYAGIGILWYKPPTSPLSAKEYTYNPEDGSFFSMASAPTNAVSHIIKTTIEVGANPEGVILANGGIDGGYGLYVKDGKLVYVNNYCTDFQKLVSSKPLVKGKNDIEVEYQKKGLANGTAILKLNGKEVARDDIRHLPLLFSYDYISFGEDIGSKVSDDYTDEFKFNGKLGDVHINIGDDWYK
ncbi:arylsulfatase [Clostridium sediminicola]|uniref:arylsulfatase n=1 Tax=Clostridium sediminicola TaxID=3114879 RepID=UPI0031F1D60E